MKRSTSRKIVRRFENAVEAYSFRGTIPAHESEAAAYAYDCIVDEYEKSKAALLRMIDSLAGGWE